MSDWQKVNVRLPAELLDIIRRVAEEEGRSLTAQIVWCVREYLKRRKSDGEQA